MFPGAIKLRKCFRSFNGLQQHIKVGCLMHKRYQHANFSEEMYQEIYEVKNTKEFPYNSIIKPMNAASEKEKQEFLSIWSEVTENFVDVCKDFAELKEHYTKLLQENVITNKQASGILVLTSYKTFADPKKLTPENVRLACILGWCVNMMLSMFMLTDDIIDGAVARYGKPSWYTRNDIGMTAISDATLIENGVFLLLRKYFSGHHCHFPAVELFHEANVKTVLGQTSDTMVHKVNGKPLLETFSVDNYNRLVKFKGSYLEYILPVTLGIYLAGKYDRKLIRMAEAFCCELGLYFTAQNDVLDCYGNPTITGKDGTDIREGRCTWLVVEALKRGTSAQKQILYENYGRLEQESEEKVRSIFDELHLLGQFLIYTENSFNAIRQIIHHLPNDINTEFFIRTAEVTYERKL